MESGCSACPSCNVAFVCGAELTTHHSTCQERSRGAAAEVVADRAQRREHLVDPAIPEASWEWRRGLQLSEIFCVPQERVARMLASEWEALYWAAATSVPVWPARTSEERVLRNVISLVKKGQLGKTIRPLDPGVFAPLAPETLEALQALHPAVDGLPASVQAASLVLQETAVEAECWQMPLGVIEVQGGADVCLRIVQALFGTVPLWCALQLDCKTAFNTVHRRAIHRAVYTDFPGLLSMTESCFRHEPWLGWRGADGQFIWARPSGSCEAFHEVMDASGAPMSGAAVPLDGIKGVVDLGPAGAAGGVAGLVGAHVEEGNNGDQGLAPSPGGTGGNGCGGHPLVAGLVSAMEDARSERVGAGGARRRRASTC
ncbi:hypothetical protein CYMTET_54431 [Cymbomonas tetramitiformis]|uniref:Uncharacterized protein n=1 Tax=Cymbomonas tetramitiformis TaxID=36881 RepID=A0AAE0BG72_9CHLO|nr:hypothetical protein CYMTET_54431 [Cymbomonas tetramitiformis]